MRDLTRQINTNKTMDQEVIPRRIDQQRWTPAETAIFNAMQEVEKMPASNTLTDAVTYLAQAKELVADHVDASEQPTVDNSAAEEK